MQVDDLLLSIDPNVDYTKIQPVQQKNTVSFVNQFTMRTVQFLNRFAQTCESRFMDFEYKLQKVEASLLILESQLSSISGLENESKIQKDDPVLKQLPELEPEEKQDNQQGILEEVKTEIVQVDGIKACEDPRYKKFFKMVQFGVPEPAVKLKMKNEGIDPSILDKPNDVIPGVPEPENCAESDDSSD
ncbi:WASH complex subunit 3 [Aethina tumida]|uniref:WASH complex subunit 3 n=1 Tax=Aethina tumida TaxID=116153 RepID=UPI00096B231C|nr:WASH complex subunit 3 [Aethina tumida]